MVAKCIARGCKSEWYPTCNVIFHKFPSDPTQRTKWLSIVPLQRPFSENAKICSLHFKETDYENSGKRLKSGVTPLYQECNVGFLPDETPWPLRDTTNEPENIPPCKKSILFELLNTTQQDENMDEKIIAQEDTSINFNPKLVEADDTVDESSSSARNDTEGFSTSVTRKFSNNDSEKFSWQKKGYIIPCEPEGDDFSINYPQEESMYTDNYVKTTDIDVEYGSEGYVCNECNEPIVGGRFTCAQCADYDLCARCAGERAAHRHHYLLRVPPRRPPSEVQRVLQTLRSILYNDSGTDKPSGDGDEDQQPVEIKTEMKDEFEAYDDPLGIEVELPADDSKTRKRISPRIDIQHTHKRVKQETDPGDEEPPAPVGAAGGGAVCEQDEPPATLIIGPAMANSLTRLAATAPLATDTISPTRAPTSAAPQSTRPPAHTRATVAVSSTKSNRRITLNPIVVTQGPKNQPQSLQKKYIMLPGNNMNSMIMHKEGQSMPIVDKSKGQIVLVSGLSQSVPTVVHGTVKNTEHTRKQDEAPSVSVTGKSSVSSVQKQSLLIENMQIRVVRDETSSNEGGSEDVQQVSDKT